MAEQEEKSEATSEAVKETHEFNKELQQVQQEKANFEKRTATLEQQNQDLRDELSRVPEPVAEVDDPEEVDAYEQVKRSKEDVANLTKELGSTKMQLKTQEAAISKMTQEANYKSSLTGLDNQYGATARNGALERARTRCIEAGYTLVGNDRPDDDTMMAVIRESYIHEHYAIKHKPVAKKNVTDNGIGGSTFNDLGEDIKEGSPEFVLEQMKALQERQ